MYQPTYPAFNQPFGTMGYQQQPAMPPQMAPQMPRGISGRVVGGLEEIAPNEVPMDGTAAFFPASDGSAVFAKAWNRDGTISTVRYIPDQGQAEQQEAAPTIADVLSQLDDMQDMLRGLTQPQAQAEPKQTRTRTRKAADDDTQR